MKQPQIENEDAGGQSRLTAGLGITGSTIAAARTESTAPMGYRLAKKPDGTLILQGAYLWQEGWNNYGHEWRDIETVEL